jgi:uncharacterized membrane protein YwzB
MGIMGETKNEIQEISFQKFFKKNFKAFFQMQCINRNRNIGNHVRMVFMAKTKNRIQEISFQKFFKKNFKAFFGELDKSNNKSSQNAP